MVANDIPMLLVMEACQERHCPEVSELRQYRLDTVDDTESMPGSLQLPQSPGEEEAFISHFEYDESGNTCPSMVRPVTLILHVKSITAYTQHS